MTLEGKYIVVTGGSSGIGKATAAKLAQAGARVLITGRNKDRLEKTAGKMGCQWLVSDVSKQEDVDALYRWISENWGNRLDVLINNAGLGEFASVEETPMESYHRVFAVNIFGPIMMVKQAIPLMKAQGQGSIVNVASTSATYGFANGSAYAASKFALRGFTQSLSEEMRRFNIRVFQINPSEVTTALGNPEREERPETEYKLAADQLAQTIAGVLQLPQKAFIPELSVWATNPR